MRARLREPEGTRQRTHRAATNFWTAGGRTCPELGEPGPSLILAGRETGGPGDWTHAQNPLADLDPCNWRQLETSTPTQQVATRTTTKTPPDRQGRAPGCENTHGAGDRECVTPMSNDCVSRGSGNRHQSPGSDPRLEECDWLSG